MHPMKRRLGMLLITLSIHALIPLEVFGAAPTVSTGSASGSQNSSKTLSGTVSAHGNRIITSRGFQYGQTTSYGSTANVSAIPTPQYSAEFGGTGTGNGQFDAPDGIAFDSDGNIYVVDQNNNRVQKFNSSGVYQSQFGSAGTGNGQFDNPTDIAIDGSDNIFVVDTSNNRVQKFNSSGVYQSQFGSAGAGDGQLNSPFGIDLDSSGNIYIADGTNNRVQKFNSSGVYQLQFTAGLGSFATPVGLATDTNDNIYVADNGNNRVQKFDTDGTFLLEWGTSGSGNGQFSGISNIAVDNSNYIYVTDNSNNRVQRFTPDGTFVDTWGTSVLSSPEGIAVNNSNNTVYISENTDNTITVWTQGTGTFSQTATGLNCGIYHYRAFATNADGTSYGSDQTFDAGSCGGGAVIIAPTSNEGFGAPLTFSIENGKATTTSRLVTLTLNGDPRTTTGYAVSASPTFENTSILPIAATAPFALPETPGRHTVYLKYYSSTGHASDILTQSISYVPPASSVPSTSPTIHQAPASVVAPTTPLLKTNVFSRSLGLGSSGEDVLRLQQFLNSHGALIATTGAGSTGHETRYFGTATRQALIRFQEMHAEHILRPLGLTHGTGIFGPATRTFVNTL